MDQKPIKESNKSYRQILKSTTIIGGSSVINIILRIIRVKFLAVLLNPSGMGLFGIYGSITDMVGTMAGMGIGSSGVRQIAEAVGTGNQEKIARTIFTLRRICLFLGVLGMILLILLSFPICRLTFGNTEYASDIALLSLTLFFGVVSGGQLALIQGMRRIGELAKLSVLGALFGTIFSIPIIYVWGQKGIVPSLIAVSAMGILTSWWYARKVKVSRIQVGWAEIQTEVKPLFELGFVIMTSALMTTGTMYLLRVLVIRKLGLGAAGLYQAAATLSSIYVGFILDSMGKDFYPRLSAIAYDNAACNQLVNEQAEVGFLLAVPGILLTLTFAPIIIQIFYSAKFTLAFEILRWQILGILLRVASWPMGFILLAKGKSKFFFWTEVLANAVHVALIWVGIVYFGLNGTGMAFFGMYVFYWILIYGVAKHLTGLTWSAANIRIALVILPTVGIVFVARSFLDDFWYMILGGISTIAVGSYSIKCLVGIVSPAGASSFLSRIKDRVREAIVW
jgi:antigen flippase